MRCYSWNVNGLRSVARKNLLPWDILPGAEVICLQETKAQPAALGELANPGGWHAYWHSALKPGYSSVGIVCRDVPDEVLVGLGDPVFDAEGRVLSVRFGSLVVVSAYFPNSQEGGKRLEYKLAFCAKLEEFLAAQRSAGRQVVLTGDYNIAHQPIDLARPKENEKNAGYLPEERAWMSRYLGLGFRDVYRERNPGLTGAYTWWTNWGGARERNIGWRIDYTTVSPDLVDQVIEVDIHPDIPGSDHCPVSITLR